MKKQVYVRIPEKFLTYKPLWMTEGDKEKGIESRARPNQHLAKFYLALLFYCQGYNHLNRKRKRLICHACRVRRDKPMRKSAFWDKLGTLNEIGLIYDQKLKIPYFPKEKAKNTRRAIDRHRTPIELSGSYFFAPLNRLAFHKDFDLKQHLLSYANKRHKSEKIVTPTVSQDTIKRHAQRHTAFLEREKLKSDGTYTRVYNSSTHIKKCEKNNEEKLITLIHQRTRDSQKEFLKKNFYETKIIAQNLMACNGFLYSKIKPRVWKRVFAKAERTDTGIKWSLPDSVFAEQAKPKIPREVLIKENRERFALRMSESDLKASPIYKRFSRKKAKK